MIESYEETRVLLAPSGELLLALPIYVDQSMVLLDEKCIEELTSIRMNIGIYEKFGYLIYNPETQPSFYLKSLDLFEDLGKI